MEDVVPKNFEEMSIEQLRVELNNAIESERYEDASTISKLIKEK